MNNDKFYDIMGDISSKHIEEARDYRPAKSPVWTKLIAFFVCLFLIVGGGIVYMVGDGLISALRRPDSFKDLIVSGDSILMDVSTTVYIYGMPCRYTALDVTNAFKLRFFAKEYITTNEQGKWYTVKSEPGYKYLIRKGADGWHSLWAFSTVDTDSAVGYTFGDMMRILCAADSADDIVSITTTPTIIDNTAKGMEIQQQVGTAAYTDIEDVRAIFDILWDMDCTNKYEWDSSANGRFTYSFSTDDSDKRFSGEETYATRRIRIQFVNGSIYSGLNYNALSGRIYELGGFEAELTDQEVFRLNEIFGIR